MFNGQRPHFFLTCQRWLERHQWTRDESWALELDPRMKVWRKDWDFDYPLGNHLPYNWPHSDIPMNLQMPIEFKDSPKLPATSHWFSHENLPFRRVFPSLPFWIFYQRVSRSRCQSCNDRAEHDSIQVALSEAVGHLGVCLTDGAIPSFKSIEWGKW